MIFFFYQLVFEFYEYLMLSQRRTPYQMFQDAMQTRDGKLTINKMIRRCGMTPEQLFNHFPSQKELIKRHYYDPQYCAYGNKGDWLFSMEAEFSGIKVGFNQPLDDDNCL